MDEMTKMNKSESGKKGRPSKQRAMIELGDGLVLTADSKCYIVGLRAETGKASIKDPSYYTTMEAALKGAIDRGVRYKVFEGTIQSLKEWLAEVTAERRELEEVLKQFKVENIGKALSN